ncbi:MAG: hypothetical protein A4E28_00734 [Methanocella sp. PtaU1.Bin125]|nr:MAG: hypothetical protein A4E28_00734 [Methanocella sp. PtaU1.Bin125]
MTEKKEEKEEEKKEEKKKRRRRGGVSNIEPAEEPVKGPTGEDIFRVK